MDIDLDALEVLAKAMPTGEVTVQERERFEFPGGLYTDYDLCVARYPFATFKTPSEVAFHAAITPAVILTLLARLRAQAGIVVAATEARHAADENLREMARALGRLWDAVDALIDTPAAQGTAVEHGAGVSTKEEG